MKNSKRKMSLFIVGMVLAQELTYTQAMAQTAAGPGQIPGGIISVGGGPGSVTGFQSSGDYNINQTVLNYSQTVEKILEQKAANNKEDREYLAAVSKRIAQSFQALIEKKRQFKALADKSALNSLNNTVELETVLSLKNDINAMVDALRIEIQSNTMISRDTLPSNLIKVGNQEIDTGSASIIDMSAAMAPFVTDLEKLLSDFSNTTFKYVHHKGKWSEINPDALMPDLSKFPAMTPEEVQEAMTKLQGLQIVSESTQKMQQRLADQIVSVTKQFIAKAGTDELLRFRNDQDKKAFQEMYNSIEDFFFLRSYVRRKFGLQIGAIQLATQYDMKKLNIEGITSSKLLFPVKEALSSLKSQVARTDDDLMAAFNNVRQFVEAYDRRLTPILSDKFAEKRAEVLKKAEAEKASLGANASAWSKAKLEIQKKFNEAKAAFASKEEIQANKPQVTDENGTDVTYSADDTGIMARMSSLWITATGQKATVEALLAVMRLVLADIREEVMLSKGDYGNMSSYHLKRFMNGEDRTVKAVQLMCNADNTLSASARASAKAVTGGKVSCQQGPGGLLNNMTNGGVVLTTFRNLLGQYQAVEISRAAQAKNLRELIDQAISANVQPGEGVNDGALFEGLTSENK